MKTPDLLNNCDARGSGENITVFLHSLDFPNKFSKSLGSWDNSKCWNVNLQLQRCWRNSRESQIIVKVCVYVSKESESWSLGDICWLQNSGRHWRLCGPKREICMFQKIRGRTQYPFYSPPQNQGFLLPLWMKKRKIQLFFCVWQNPFFPLSFTNGVYSLYVLIFSTWL